ncbi:hypothetical protein ACRAWF_44665 [Streptomyces sp. L7]
MTLREITDRAGGQRRGGAVRCHFNGRFRALLRHGDRARAGTVSGRPDGGQIDYPRPRRDDLDEVAAAFAGPMMRRVRGRSGQDLAVMRTGARIEHRAAPGTGTADRASSRRSRAWTSLRVLGPNASLESTRS